MTPAHSIHLADSVGTFNANCPDCRDQLEAQRGKPTKVEKRVYDELTKGGLSETQALIAVPSVLALAVTYSVEASYASEMLANLVNTYRYDGHRAGPAIAIEIESVIASTGWSIEGVRRAFESAGAVAPAGGFSIDQVGQFAALLRGSDPIDVGRALRFAVNVVAQTGREDATS